MKSMNFFKHSFLYTALLSLLFFSACEDDDPVEEEVPETITTTILTFTPAGGGSPLTFEAYDPDGDGPESTTLDDIVLEANTTYTLTIELLNELLEPTDEEYNITAEVEEEGEEHMFFFGWSADVFSDPTNGNIQNNREDVNYEDTDDGVLPIGLETTWTTGEAGSTGSFRVVLKHQPDGIKSATSTVNDGESDIDHDFDITVQ